MKRYAWYIAGGFLAWRTFEAWRGQIPIWTALLRPLDTGKSIREMKLARHADLCAKQNPDWSTAQCREKAAMSFPPMNIFGTPKSPTEPPPAEGGGELVLGGGGNGEG